MPRGGDRPVCSIEGCGRPHFGHGLCGKHYQRLRDLGNLDHVKDRHEQMTVSERMVELLLTGIEKQEDGCWICTKAYPTRSGYQRLQVVRNRVVHRASVHRVSFEHFQGPIAPRNLVCHRCDYRPCCNPDHLFQGTHSDNTKDMVKKQRGLVGVLNTNSAFTESDVLAMYQDEDSGMRRIEIARKYGVKPETISHILTGRNWSHLFLRHRA